MNEEKERFQYTYSSKEQEEIRRLREKYTIRENRKLDELRRLDAAVERPGLAAALAVGSLGILLFGAGMSGVLLLTGMWFWAGVLAGLLGIAAMIGAYPLYRRITRRRRERFSSEILRLSGELIQE